MLPLTYRCFHEHRDLIRVVSAGSEWRWVHPWTGDHMTSLSILMEQLCELLGDEYAVTGRTSTANRKHSYLLSRQGSSIAIEDAEWKTTLGVIEDNGAVLGIDLIVTLEADTPDDFEASLILLDFVAPFLERDYEERAHSLDLEGEIGKRSSRTATHWRSWPTRSDGRCDKTDLGPTRNTESWP